MMILELPLSFLFATNIKKGVCGVLGSLIFFQRRFDKKNLITC
jgi:hypothetical protein